MVVWVMVVMMVVMLGGGGRWVHSGGWCGAMVVL